MLNLTLDLIDCLKGVRLPDVGQNPPRWTPYQSPSFLLLIFLFNQFTWLLLEYNRTCICTIVCCRWLAAKSFPRATSSAGKRTTGSSTQPRFNMANMQNSKKQNGQIERKGSTNSCNKNKWFLNSTMFYKRCNEERCNAPKHNTGSSQIPREPMMMILCNIYNPQGTARKETLDLEDDICRSLNLSFHLVLSFLRLLYNT